jgi:hypothetical protein
MKKIILVAVSIAALIFTIGSLGAFDKANIGLTQCLIQCAIGVCAEWLALKNIEM